MKALAVLRALILVYLAQVVLSLDLSQDLVNWSDIFCDLLQDIWLIAPQITGSSPFAAGYADFPLIAFHFQTTKLLTPNWIPLFYIVALGASAISALLFGWIYDRRGCAILILAVMLSSMFAPLVFLGNFAVALVGMILWGIGMGAQRSLLKAVIGDMVSKQMRGSAYGIFNAGYGIAWFLGSWLIGILYDVSIPYYVQHQKYRLPHPFLLMLVSNRLMPDLIFLLLI